MTTPDHVIRWTARAPHRAHWRCTCGEWCTTTSRSGDARDAAEIAATAHLERSQPCEP